MLLVAVACMLTSFASVGSRSPEPTIVLRGRAVGLDGGPIRSLQIASHSLPAPRVGPGRLGPSDSVFHGAFPVWTEDDGGFEITLVADRALEDAWYLVLEERGDRPGGGDPPRSARLDRLFPWVAGEHDLGKVVLEPTPGLVSGRVLDELGGAIEHATVSVQIGQTWVFPASVSPGPDGTFAFLRDTPRRSISLHVTGVHGYVEAPMLEVAPGTTNLDVRLHRAGSVSGRLRWPEEAPPKAFELRLLPRNVDAAEAWASHEPDGSFYANQLVPGRWRLHVEALPLEWPSVDESEPRLALERDFDVVAGTVTFLGELVPAPSLHVWRVRSDTAALVFSGWWSDPTTNDGPYPFDGAEIRSLTVPTAIAVGAAGFRDALFEDPATKTLVLRPGIPVALQVQMPQEPVAPGSSLCVGLAPEGTAEAPPPWLWTGPLDERGSVRWEAPRPGVYRVWWILRSHTSSRFHAVRDTTAIVEIEERAVSEPRFELAPSVAARVELEDRLRDLVPVVFEADLEMPVRSCPVPWGDVGSSIR